MGSEKNYISIYGVERETDENLVITSLNSSLPSLSNGETVEKKEEEDGIERYKKINSVIAPRPRRYRKNAVRDRCRQFAQDLEAQGFVFGDKFTLRDLKHWIVALDLAHDKLTVKQYIERLVIYGYFVLKQGIFTFCGSRRPGQLSLIAPEKIMGSLRACLHTDRRVKRRSY